MAHRALGSRVVGWLVVGALAGALVAAAAAPGSAAGVAKPGRGGAITFGLEAETTGGFCPPQAQLATSGIQIVHAIYDTLVMPSRRTPQRIQPYLARSVIPNADATEWTITLRDGVTFHDGTPLDAEALKLNLDSWRGTNPRLPSRLLSFVFSNIADVTVVDPLTVTVTTKTPWPAFDWVLWGGGRYGIAAPAQLNDPASCATNMIGTGPFRLQEWKPNERLVVTRNDDYWQRGLPLLDTITFRPIPDASARVTQLQSGQLDVAHTNAAPVIDQMRAAGKKVVVEPAGHRQVTYLILNAKKPPFDDPQARQAVARALDRKQLNEILNRGELTVADQPFDTRTLGHTRRPGFPAYDVKRAKRLVAAVKQRTGSFDMEIATTNDPENLKTVQLVKEQLGRVGIGSDIKVVDQATLISEFLSGGYQMATTRNHAGTDPDAQYVWWATGSPVNFNKLADDRIQADLDTGRTSTDPATRRRAYEDVSKAFGDEAYNVWLWYSPWAWGHADAVSGFGGVPLPGGGRALVMNGGLPLLGLHRS